GPRRGVVPPRSRDIWLAICVPPRTSSTMALANGESEYRQFGIHPSWKRCTSSERQLKKILALLRTLFASKCLVITTYFDLNQFFENRRRELCHWKLRGKR